MFSDTRYPDTEDDTRAAEAAADSLRNQDAAHDHEADDRAQRVGNEAEDAVSDDELVPKGAALAVGRTAAKSSVEVTAGSSGNDAGSGNTSNTASSGSSSTQGTSAFTAADASGAGRGGDHGGDSANDDPEGEKERRLRAQHIAAFPRFAPQVEEARDAYREGDPESHPAFKTYGGQGNQGSDATAVFEIVDPADGSPCVVNIHPEDEHTQREYADRYEALLRGAMIDDDSAKEDIEQPVAYEPTRQLIVRGTLSGDQLATIPTEVKSRIDTAVLATTHDRLNTMATHDIVPTTAYGQNTLVDATGTTVRTRFVDYGTLEQEGDPEGSKDFNAAQAFLGFLQVAGAPSAAEAGQVSAWQEGARLYRAGRAILEERHPDIEIYRGEVYEAVSPEQAEREHLQPDLPFHQGPSHTRLSSSGREAEVQLVRSTAGDFIRNLRGAHDFQPSQEEEGVLRADVTARDGRQIDVRVREDADGNITASSIGIPSGPGTVTRYLALYTTEGQANGDVIRREPHWSGTPSDRPVGMQEFAGFADYLGVNLADAA